MATGMSPRVPDAVRRDLDRLVAEQQAEHRIPGLLAGVVRDGQVLWRGAVGAADVAEPDEPPTPDTQYAIGSITKTFTATLVMALRDEGRLELDDTLRDHLPGTKHEHVTVRRMLAHASGLQREPVGDVWDSLQDPTTDGLLQGLEQAEQVLPPRGRWHYSNLAYSLLGEVVSRVNGRPWATALRERILEPLGMGRTSTMPEGRAAVGYYADPFADAVEPQPVNDLEAMAPAGALWSTLDDLTRWAQFLAKGDDAVLKGDTVEEMAQVQIMADTRKWTLAWGLGLELFRVGDRILVGHTGGMPGFLTAVTVHKESGTAGIVLANSLGDLDPGIVAGKLVGTLLDADPPLAEPWRPGHGVPDHLRAVMGRWWSEGSPFEFFVRNGNLHARAESAPRTVPPAVFERIDEVTFRTVSGREQGELLRLTYGDGGAVTVMHWATYRVTRGPEAFGAD
ncbi:MAG: beta-lactamase family protein [Actinomycetota bacterium]|nr:beta-lactamase family protein [Actinomycetota bacterium]